MKRTRIRMVSKRRYSENKIYNRVKEYVKKRFVEIYGIGEMVPCMRCGLFDWTKNLELHHRRGRHGQEPGEINRLFDPAWFLLICRTCHEHETNHKCNFVWLKDYQNFKDFLNALSLDFLEAMPPIAGKMKWSVQTQGEAIFKVLDELEGK